MVSDKRPGLRLCRKEFPQRQRVVKQLNYLRGKKNSVCVDRHTGRPRGRHRVAESCLCGSLDYFYGTFLPGFLWPIMLICLLHSPYLVYLRILPCVSTHLLAKMDLTEKAYRYGTSLDMTPRSLLCACVVGEVS